ncbi:ABC transporter substrate-binding protein [Aquibacillus albus]|uniref:Raffinose/stachyose/melibiose transport system substrate-binding protein n=1 Tax=Aquibacillus albus TaxID=1168171 RepID=A0ABS2N699_9BACI|nr:extracellular solute-binding protein [Aquibacillus albus]MBM7573657.1 raffinose/stachyose/melibiose transport system substrate-binding protein [Aquibacillus albus]
MFNNKKFLSILLAAVFAVLVLAGCNSEVGNASNDSANNEETDSSSNEGEVVELELFSTKTENPETYQRLVDKFEAENPNIKVEVVSQPDSLTVLKTRLTKNDLPDIIATGGNPTFGELGRAGVLKDFTDSPLVDDINEGFLYQVKDIVSYDEENVYGIPYAGNAVGVLYNKAKFKELGLEIPTTWDEFIEVADKIEAAGEVPFYHTWKDAWTITVPWNDLVINIAGDDFAQSKTEGEATFIDRYSEVADKMLTLRDYSHNDVFGKSYADGNQAFANGESVMYLQGNFAVPAIKEFNPDIELGMFTLPALNDADENMFVASVDVLFTMPKDAEHPEETMKFIEFMYEEENATQYMEEQFAISAMNNVTYIDPIMEPLKDKLAEGKIRQAPTHYYPAGFPAAQSIQEFLIDGDKDAFLKKMDKDWDAAVAN